MNKKKFREMGYQEVVNNSKDDMDTMYKKHENGNMWIVQFNEEVQKDAIGMIYLTSEQVKQILK